MNKSERLLPTTPVAIQLAELGRQIREFHQEAEFFKATTIKQSEEFVAKALQVGQFLIDAKRLVGHGMFMEWVKANCGFAQTQSIRYMTITRYYQNNPNSPHVVNFRAAAALINDEAKLVIERAEIPAYLTGISRANKLVKFVEENAISEWPAEGRARVVEMLRPIVDQLPELREPTTGSAGVPRSRNLLGVEG